MINIQNQNRSNTLNKNQNRPSTLNKNQNRIDSLNKNYLIKLNTKNMKKKNNKKLFLIACTTTFSLAILSSSIFIPIYYSFNQPLVVNDAYIIFENNFKSKIETTLKTLIGSGSATQVKNNYLSLENNEEVNKFLLEEIKELIFFKSEKDELIPADNVLKSININVSPWPTNISPFQSKIDIPQINVTINSKINILNKEDLNFVVSNLGYVIYNPTEITLGLTTNNSHKVEIQNILKQLIGDGSPSQKKKNYLNLPTTAINNIDFKNAINSYFTFSDFNNKKVTNAIKSIQLQTFSWPIESNNIPNIKINVTTDYKLSPLDSKKLEIDIVELGKIENKVFADTTTNNINVAISKISNYASRILFANNNGDLSGTEIQNRYRTQITKTFYSGHEIMEALESHYIFKDPDTNKIFTNIIESVTLSGNLTSHSGENIISVNVSVKLKDAYKIVNPDVLNFHIPNLDQFNVITIFYDSLALINIKNRYIGPSFQNITHNGYWPTYNSWNKYMNNNTISSSSSTVYERDLFSKLKNDFFSLVDKSIIKSFTLTSDPFPPYISSGTIKLPNFKIKINLNNANNKTYFNITEQYYINVVDMPNITFR